MALALLATAVDATGPVLVELPLLETGCTKDDDGLEPVPVMVVGREADVITANALPGLECFCPAIPAAGGTPGEDLLECMTCCLVGARPTEDGLCIEYAYRSR